MITSTQAKRLKSGGLTPSAQTRLPRLVRQPLLAESARVGVTVGRRACGNGNRPAKPLLAESVRRSDRQIKVTTPAVWLTTSSVSSWMSRDRGRTIANRSEPSCSDSPLSQSLNAGMSFSSLDMDCAKQQHTNDSCLLFIRFVGIADTIGNVEYPKCRSSLLCHGRSCSRKRD